MVLVTLFVSLAILIGQTVTRHLDSRSGLLYQAWALFSVGVQLLNVGVQYTMYTNVPNGM
jgi:uncharacterized membrane protein